MGTEISTSPHLKIGTVFLPADVSLAISAGAVQCALGVCVAARSSRRRARHRPGADTPAGGSAPAIPPLLVAGLLALAVATGSRVVAAAWPAGFVELLLGLVAARLAYAAWYGAVARRRRRRLRSPLVAETPGLRPRGPALFGIVALSLVATGVSAWLIAPLQPAQAESYPQAGRKAPSVRLTVSRVNWVQQSYTLTYQGLERNYLVYRPASVSAQKLPVVVELSGCCIPGASYEADRANFRAVADPAILVYPSYVGTNWNAGACCGSAPAAGIDDPGFVMQTLAQVKAQQPDAAPGPAYLAGYSNGGKLAMELVCNNGSQFAAVAVYGATRTSNCRHPSPIPVLMMAGTSDPLDPISGSPVVQDGYTEPTVQDLLRVYVRADGCRAGARRSSAGNLTETVWSACAGAMEVGEAVWSGKDHGWPQTHGSSPSAQQIMWDWFASIGA